MSLKFDDFVCEIRTKAQSEAAKLAERMLQMMKEADPTLGVCEEATDMLREALFYMKNNQRISEMEISTDDMAYVLRRCGENGKEKK